VAGYERNPRLQRRLSLALAMAETLALTVNFSLIFTAYANFLDAMANRPMPPGILFIVSVMVTVAGLVATLLLCRKFIKGASWPRWVLILANLSLIVLGVMWYARVSVGGKPAPWVGFCGLILPMVTLFPLLWPLITFKPKTESPAAAPSARPAAEPETRSQPVRLPPSTKPPVS
jgi:hypothetical protein